jgi:PAS domain S-box-containing protein
MSINELIVLDRDLEPLQGLLHQLENAIDPAHVSLVHQLRTGLERYQQQTRIQFDGLQRQLREESNRRQQVEAQYHQCERRYASALGGSNSGVWEWNVRTGKIFFSARWQEALGYTEGGLGDTVEEWSLHIHPDDLPGLERRLTPILRGTHRPFRSEFRLRCKDGSYKWFEASGQVLDDTADGRPERLIGLLTEITARKQAQAALRQSEERYRTLVERSPDAILLQRHGRFVYANEAALRLFGATSPSQLLGKTPYDVTPAADHERIRERIDQALTQPDTLTLLEQRVIRLDGTVIVTQLSTALIVDLGGPALQITLRDITEQKRVARARQAQHEVVKALYETTLGLINRLDLSELLRAILARARQLMNTPDGILFLFDPERDCMVAEIGDGIAEAWVGLEIHRSSPGIISHVWASKQPQAVLDYDRWPNRLPNVQEQSNTSLLCVPILAGGAVMGVLGLSRPAGQPFGEDEIELLVQFGQLAALAIQNAQLYTAVQQELAERCRIEAALRTSEQRLRRMVEQLPAGAVYVEGDSLSINRQAELITGYNRDEIATVAAWFQKLYPERSEQMLEFFAGLGEQAYAKPITSSIVRKDGTSCLVELTVFQEGQNAVWLLRDVTESERLPRLLAQTERAAHVGGWELNLASGELYWTEELYRILEVDPAQFTPTLQALQSFQPDSTNEVIDQVIAHCLATGEAIDLVLEQRTYTGRTIWTRVTAAVDYHNGVASRLFGSVQDITATKEIEQALQASEERLQLAFESSEEAHWDWDLTTGKLFMSQQWARLLGYSSLEALHDMEAALAHVHPEDMALIESRLDDHFAGRTPYFEAQYRLRHCDGHWVWGHSQAKVVAYDPQGKPLRMVGIVRDISHQKQVEDALRTSEAKYRLLIETTGTGYAITDEQGRIVEANEEYLRLTGRESTAEIIGHLPLEWTAPYAREHNQAALVQLLSLGRISNLEVDYQWPNGQVMPVEINATRMESEQGIRYLALCRDISGRKAAESALLESERRFRQLAEHIDGVFWLTEANPNRLLYVSPNYERLWGRPASALFTHPYDWLESIHPEDRERVYTAITTKQLRGDYDEEYRLVQPDGSIRWVRDRSFLIFDEQDNVYRVVGLTEEITERKQAAEALRESEERFRQLAENISEAFWLVDNRSVLYVSPAYEKILGRPAEEFYREAWNWLDAVHPEDRERVRLAALAKQRIGIYDEEYRVIREDGTTRWVRDRAFPIHDEQGQVIRIAGLTEDITARKRQAAAMEQLIVCSQATGRTFFTKLVQTLADVLGVRHVQISTIDASQPQVAHALATWQDGAPGEATTYDLANSPFQQVLLHDVYFHQAGVRDHFPADPLLAALNAESYLGAILYSVTGAPMGLLSVIHDQPLDELAIPPAILAIFAGRVATELAREAAEQELQRQRNEFQQMLDAVNALVWRLDAEGRVVHANQMAWQIMPTQEAPIGRTMSELFPRDPDVRWLDEQNRAVIASGQPQLGQIVEWQIYERMRWSSVDQIPLHDATGKVNGLLVFVYGITELKEAEQQIKDLNARLELRVQERTAELAAANEALQRSEQQLRQIIDLVPHRIYAKDLKGRFLLANQPVANHYGVTVEALLGKTPAELGDLDAQTDQAVDQDLALSHNGQFRATQLRRVRDRLGREQILHTTIVPFTFAGTDTPAIVGIAIDMTEQQRVEEELRRSEARQRALLEAIPDMVFRIRRDGIFLDFSAPPGAPTLIPAEHIREFNVRNLPLSEQALKDSLAAYERAIDTGIIQTVEYSINNPQGTEYFESRIVRSGPDEVVSIVRNITERVKAAADLRASEKKFSMLFYTSPLPMLITHLKTGRYVDINERGLDLLERQRDEVIGRTSEELGAWLRLGGTKRFIRQLRKQGAVRNMELSFRIRPGDVREILVSAAIIEIDGEECIFWAATDITERKRMDEELRLSQQRLRQIIDLVPHLIFAKDIEGRFILNNRASAALYGLTPDELLGKTDAEFALSPDEVAQFRRDDQEVLANGSIRIIPEEQVTDVTGRVHWLHTIKIPFTFSGTTTPAVLGVSTDITELKLAEVALHESEARFRQFAEHMPFIVWMLSPDTERFVYINSAFEEVIGRSIDLLADNRVRRWLKVVHPEDRRKVTAFLRQLHQLEPLQIEFRILRPNGEERWLNIRYFPVRNEAGELALHSGIAEDVTQRKRAETELYQLNEELEERVRRRTRELESANRELESFSYSVSHDLRAPLRAINGFSQALMEDYGHRLDEEGLNYLNRVRAASQRMAVLIDDLLTLSRVARQEIRRAPINLSSLAESILEELRHAQPHRQVEFFITPNLWAVADPNLVQIVLDNLLRNAWKYTSKHDKARIEFGQLTSNDAGTVYFVRDDGAGFDMAYVDKLFGAFQRLHRDSEFEGNGVGLATVQRIIHRHGGRTWAEGAPEQGATFYFTLPS